jgi:glycosyltransferase involved in cell wall biosynthesis
MRVLLNCISAVSGGGKTYLRNLSAPLFNEFINRKQHQLFFLVHLDQLEYFREIPQTFIILLNCQKPTGFTRIFWERLNLPKIVKDNKIDVLFTPYQVGLRIANIKNVLMIRNMEPFYFKKYEYSFNTWLRNNILAFASNHCLRRADRIIAVSRFAADYLRNLGILDQSTSIVYHGRPLFANISGNDYNRLADLGINCSFIFTCGSMLPYRRYEDVINAFNSALSVIPSDTILVIAGTGTDLEYKKMLIGMIANSPKPERIIMLGNVQWSDMAILYRNSISCVIASEIEACPNIALEAMTAGSCIIASDKPPLPEILDECAIFYPPRNISALTHQIVCSIQDNNKRYHYSLQAKQRAHYFSWSLSAIKTYEALTNFRGIY